jgi:hypothetical protein
MAGLACRGYFSISCGAQVLPNGIYIILTAVWEGHDQWNGLRTRLKCDLVGSCSSPAASSAVAVAQSSLQRAVHPRGSLHEQSIKSGSQSSKRSAMARKKAAAAIKAPKNGTYCQLLFNIWRDAGALQRHLNSGHSIDTPDCQGETLL